MVIGGYHELDEFKTSLKYQPKETFLHKNPSNEMKQMTIEPTSSSVYVDFEEYNELQLSFDYDDDTEWKGLNPSYFQNQFAIVVFKPEFNKKWLQTYHNMLQFMQWQQESPVVILINTHYYSEEQIQQYQEQTKQYIEKANDTYLKYSECPLTIVYQDIEKEIRMEKLLDGLWL